MSIRVQHRGTLEVPEDDGSADGAWTRMLPRAVRDGGAVDWLDRSGLAGGSSQSWRSFGGG